MEKQRSIFVALSSCAAALALTLASQVSAGYIYEMEQTEYKNGKAGKTGSVTIQVEGSNVKMSGFGKDKGEMIYQGKDQSMLIIDHKRKSYTALDKASIEEMANQLNAAMAQMEEQLAAVPPAQREMMEKMMKSRMPQAATEKAEVSIKRTGEEEKIEGYATEKVEVQVNGRKQSEMWIAPWEDLEGSEEIAESFKGMSEMFEGIVEAFSQGPFANLVQGQMQSSWLEQMEELQGFPIRSREFNASGQIETETVLAKVEEQKIDASVFRAPKGYKEQKMMGK